MCHSRSAIGPAPQASKRPVSWKNSWDGASYNPGLTWSLLLLAQVAALQKTLTSRNPNSLAAVISAAKPSQEQLAAVQHLGLEKEALQQQLVREQREHEHVLRSLRQQYEQLKGQLEQRLAEVKQASMSIPLCCSLLPGCTWIQARWNTPAVF